MAPKVTSRTSSKPSTAWPSKEIHLARSLWRSWTTIVSRCTPVHSLSQTGWAPSSSMERGCTRQRYRHEGATRWAAPAFWEVSYTSLSSLIFQKCRPIASRPTRSWDLCMDHTRCRSNNTSKIILGIARSWARNVTSGGLFLSLRLTSHLIWYWTGFKMHSI